MSVSDVKKRFRLSDMKLDFVSLVARGDDPLAQVVLSKAAPEEDCSKCGKKHDSSEKCPHVRKDSNDLQEDNMGEKIAKDDLSPEVVAYIDALEDEVDTLSKSVEDKDGEITELRDTLSKSAPKDEESAEAISKALLAKADPAVRALIEKQQADLAEASRIAKAEREARLEREYVSKAEALPMLTEDKKDLAGLLRRVADALPAEDVTKWETILKAANEQIAKGGLFDTLGHGGGVTTVSESAEAKASEIQKAEPGLTRDQALAKAYDENPGLLAEAMNQEG